MSQLNEIMSARVDDSDSSFEEDFTEYLLENDPIETLKELKSYVMANVESADIFLQALQNSLPKVTEEKRLLLANIRVELMEFINLSNNKLKLLMQACDEYLAHLEFDVKKIVRQCDNDLYKNVFEEDNKGVGLLLGYHDQLDEERKPTGGEGSNFYNDQKKLGAITPRGSKLFITLDKCNVIFALRNALSTNSDVINTRLIKFEQILEQGSAALKQNRDSATVKFLKSVRTILFSMTAFKRGFFFAKKMNEASHGANFINNAEKLIVEAKGGGVDYFRKK